MPPDTDASQDASGQTTTQSDTGGTTDAGNAEGSTFTQADVDRIVAERLSRERGKYADYKTLKAKADQFDQVAEAQKTETQRLEERATAAERLAAEREHELLRLRVAGVKGLPAELAARLRGGSEDELAEDADRLLALVKPAASAPAPPPPDARQGVRGQAAAPPDENAWIRRMAGRQ